jgi:acyl-CoA thioesterase
MTAETWRPVCGSYWILFDSHIEGCHKGTGASTGQLWMANDGTVNLFVMQEIYSRIIAEHSKTKHKSDIGLLYYLFKGSHDD